jgi:hypothetical protein
MKQLLSLFLFLLPCLAWAQYPSNGNQKITLGEQTTADGLIYRGVLADTGIITPLSDTSAYIILDTANHRFYNYNRATNVWSVAGGGTAVTSITGGTGLTGGTITTSGTLAADTSFLFTQTDTTTVKYVNTYGTQTVNGVKTFTDTIIVNKGIRFPATQSASTNVNTLDDYEEGTWTTTFGAKGNLTGTPSLSSAIYRKIGQIVYIEGRVGGLTITTSNANTYIVFSVPINMNNNSTSQVGNVYTYTGSTDMSGIITDATNGDNTTVAIIIPNALVTAGSLSDLLFSITYIANN